MKRESLKKIKLIYYPYRLIKNAVNIIRRPLQYQIQYRVALSDIKRTRNTLSERHASEGGTIKVVFITQFIPGWAKQEIIYKKMLLDSRFKPYIVCVPSIIEKKNTPLINDTYQYFIEHGFEAINAIKDDGEWFDISALKADYVFHSRPYNHFMPIQYSSKMIRKYSLICNVIYGTNVTLNGQNTTLNKDYFMDVFCYFAFDEYEKNFYEKRFMNGINKGIQKVYPYGAAFLEEMLSLKGSERLNRKKKTVLWTPRWSTDPYIGGSNFFNYKNLILSFVNENPDICFIIRPHPLMFDNFVRTGEMTQEEVKQFRLVCEETPNLMLDETNQYFKTFWESDFIITDISGMLPEYYLTSHPMIFCRSDVKNKCTDLMDFIIESNYAVNDERELKEAFMMLVENNDYKLEKRKKDIANMFGNELKYSDQILTTLHGVVNNVE